MLNIILYILLALLATAGVVLTALTLPGIWLVYIAVFILAWMGSFAVITPLILVILFVLSVFSTIADNIVMAMGAKRLGGSNWGMLGAILGGIVGLMVGNIPGMFAGPIVGATLFELLFSHKDLKSSFKAGIGSFLGILFSIVLKLGFTIGMIVYVLSLVI